MNIFFTGSTGVIGRHTVPHLIAAGHDVAAVARSANDHAWLNELGARPVEIDLLDPVAVSTATVGTDALIHMATAIPSQNKMPKRASWAMNDRLRTEATSHLVDAAIANGVERFVQQSISFVYADGADRWLTEDAPVQTAWDVLDSAIEAERQVGRYREAGGTGIVLRFSSLYGPGRASAEYIAAVAARKLPIIGRGDNYVSHIHAADAATAIVSALEAPGGVYNVSDDTPVTKRQELESLAAAVGAKAPRSIPAWLGKTVVGPATSLLTISQRVSNARLKAATGWAPEYPTVTTGWRNAVRSTASVG